jgi:putative hydrolase of the HAD superfamily
MRDTVSIQGVIFDFGGVLWNMRWEVSHELERAHDLPRGALFQTLYRTPAWAEIERGRGSRAAWREEAHRLLEAKAGRLLPPLHEEWRRRQGLIPENVALARRLRPRCRTAVLSNADASLRQRLRAAGIHDLFDTVVSSAEEGMAKPEPAVYHLAAARLGLPVAACLFVDDYEPNVAAATGIGMAAVLFRLDHGHDLGRLLGEVGLDPASGPSS